MPCQGTSGHLQVISAAEQQGEGTVAAERSNIQHLICLFSSFHMPLPIMHSDFDFVPVTEGYRACMKGNHPWQFLLIARSLQLLLKIVFLYHLLRDSGI